MMEQEVKLGTFPIPVMIAQWGGAQCDSSVMEPSNFQPL